MNQKKRSRDSNSFVFKFLHAVWVIIESFSYPLVSILIESEHWNGIGSRKNLQIYTLNKFYCFWAAWVWTSSSAETITGLSSQWYFILGFSAVVNAAMYVPLPWSNALFELVHFFFCKEVSMFFNCNMFHWQILRPVWGLYFLLLLF